MVVYLSTWPCGKLALRLMTARINCSCNPCDPDCRVVENKIKLNNAHYPKAGAA